MKTLRILILEDELEALYHLTKALYKLEDKLFKKGIDIAVTIISEQKEAEELINTKAENDYDIILLDRDTKEGGSFHVLDLDKFKCEKIISISSDHIHNTTAKEMGIEKICYKDFEKIEEWSKQVVFLVEQVIS